MMRRQTLIALGIAIMLGLFAVFLANAFLTRTERQAAVQPQGMSKIAVAAVPLDYGVELTPDKIRFVAFPQSSIPPGSFQKITDLLPAGKRRVALRQMLVNEPILANKISGEGQGASISALLPDGMRATALRINDVSGVAGFIEPNDSVDVLITRDLGGAQVTDVLLQDVRVIAIGQNAATRNGAPALARSATVEVDPLNAQKLVLAQQVGTLSLVLRKPGADQNNPFVETVSMQDLRYSLLRRTGRDPASASPSTTPRVTRTATVRPVRRTAPVVRAPPPPRTNSIQIVRGTEGNNYEVGDYGS